MGHIQIRVDDDVKQRIADAARRKGQSRTTFILSAITRAIDEAADSKTATTNGVPAYFQSALKEKRGAYELAGWNLATRLRDSRPASISPGKWKTELQRLRTALRDGNDAAALAWFTEHFSACMAIVPARRRKAFLRGVVDARP